MTPATASPGKGLDALALLRRLTSRDRFILRTLADHQVLTTDQIADLAFGSLRAAQQRLATLAALGAVGRFRRTLPAGSEPWRYYLAPAGAALVAAERGQPAPAARVIERRAVALAASQRLGHLLGVNGFFASLAAAARASGGACVLSEWWSEQRCAAEYGTIVRPDGYGAWACAGRVTGFFLEYDNGTETTTRVAAKLAQHADLADAERPACWCCSGCPPPPVRRPCAPRWAAPPRRMSRRQPPRRRTASRPARCGWRWGRRGACTWLTSRPVLAGKGGERPTPEPARSCPASPPASRKRARKRRTSDDSGGKYDLCDDDREWVARTASRLGPLTDRQRDILARLLRTRR